MRNQMSVVGLLSSIRNNFVKPGTTNKLPVSVETLKEADKYSKKVTWTTKPKPAELSSDMLMHNEGSMEGEGGWSNGDVYYLLL